jgi:hypothetical protein
MKILICTVFLYNGKYLGVTGATSVNFLTVVNKMAREVESLGCNQITFQINKEELYTGECCYTFQ